KRSERKQASGPIARSVVSPLMPTSISICADVIPRLGSAARASTFGGSALRIGRLLDARLLDGGRVIARDDLRAFSDRQSSRQLKRSNIASRPCRYPPRSGRYETASVRRRHVGARSRQCRHENPGIWLSIVNRYNLSTRI